MGPRFVLVRSGPHNGSAVALLLHVDPQGWAWIRKWRTSRKCFAKPARIHRLNIVGDALPTDARRVAAARVAFGEKP